MLHFQTDQNGILLLFATVGSHKGVAAMALSARFVREEATMNQVSSTVMPKLQELSHFLGSRLAHKYLYLYLCATFL